VSEQLAAAKTTVLDLPALFGRRAPVDVDLGCGDGSFLRSLAAQMPDKNFLGIERLLNRVRSSTRKAAEVENVRILRAETSFVVTHLLPAESIAAFYLLFPDPWPKRRHHRRRLVTQNFLDAIWTALIPTGSVTIATDHVDYFDAISRLITGTKRFVMIDQEFLRPLPLTTFEKKFRAAGAPIHRLELRKVSPVT
jgi:tRNA (guanine-N7-)-methyltransferase